MMPIQPEELSALLDGELDAARAAQVRAAIQMDPVLREEFDALSAADAAWGAAADSAAFTPAVMLSIDTTTRAPAEAKGSGWLAALTVAIASLIGVRIALKLAGSDALAFGLPMVSLLLLVAAVIDLTRGMASSRKNPTSHHWR